MADFEFGVSDWLRIIGSLANLTGIPHAELAGKLATIAGDLIASERARTNQTTEEILSAAGLKADETEALIQSELKRLDTSPLPAPTTE